MTEGNDPSPILGEIDSLARAQHVPVRLVSHRRLESVQGTESPQGVVAFAEPLEAVSLEELVFGAAWDPSSGPDRGKRARSEPELDLFLDDDEDGAAASELGLVVEDDDEDDGSELDLDRDDDDDDDDDDEAELELVLDEDDEDDDDGSDAPELEPVLDDEDDEDDDVVVVALHDELDEALESEDDLSGLEEPGEELAAAGDIGEAADEAGEDSDAIGEDGSAAGLTGGEQTADVEVARIDDGGHSGGGDGAPWVSDDDGSTIPDSPAELDRERDGAPSPNADTVAGERRAAESCFLVLVDGVTDPQNLGAILRSAECAGATGVVIPRHRSAHVTPAVTKAAAGAIEHLSMALVAGIPSALQDLGRLGVTTVGLDERGERDIFDIELGDRPVALVLGAEGAGLGPLARKRCDVLARIPLSGEIPSLNVSAAAAVACFEVARQRRR